MDEDETIYGARLENKLPDSWRFMGGNMGGLPNERSGHGKLKLDKWKHLATQECDLNFFSELNVDEGMLQHEDKISSLVSGWWNGSMCRSAYLKEKDRMLRTKRQQGGVGMITNGKCTSHLMEQGSDRRNLGRWQWITLRGKEQDKVCIISAYRTGASWVTTQNQLVALQTTDDNTPNYTDPVILWKQDLTDLITDKKQQGCKIILTGDFNDDVSSETSDITILARSLGLREVLTEKYGAAPNTYSRGQTPIDGVFMSVGLTIVQGGYTSFEDSPSDHRWIWFDILTSELLGSSMEERARPIERKATSKIPSVRDRFNKLLNSHLCSYVPLAKVTEFFESCELEMNESGEISDHNKNTMNIYDDRIQRSVRYADRLCRKARTGKVPFSEEAQIIMGAMRIQKLMLLRIKLKGRKGRPRKQRLSRLAKRYKYTRNISETDMVVVKKLIYATSKEYSIFRPQAHEFRSTYLGRIADELSKEDGIPAEIHFRNLQTQEDSIAQHRRIKRAEKRGHGGGVSAVEKEEGGSRILLTNKNDIEIEVAHANKKRVQQAHNTPLREHPLQDLLGEQLDFKRWEEILAGLVDLPDEGIEEGTRLWYEYITNQNTDHHVEINWTTQEYFQSWSKMKENKGSAPGIHFGHMKCINPESEAAEIISLMALCPLKTGYSPDKWRIGIDSMIPKKQHDLRPEKLRLILLMDARFNHNNKLIGKMMMEYGEDNDLLAKEQYGSRKEKSAVQHATNKRLVLDILRQYKIPAIYCANDAKSCYDRIVMMVGYLMMRIYGIPGSAAKCSVETISLMKHHIRTVFGDSEFYYGGEKWKEEGGEYPHGNGQGNGNGPAVWAAISSPLLQILREQGYGIDFVSAISNEILILAAFGFVDDMDYIQTCNDDESEEELLARTQNGMNLWESLLRTTGGAIVVEIGKTDWARISFEQKKDELIMKKKNDNEKLYIRNTDGDIKELQQLDASTARKTLGVMQCLTGDETAEVDYLLDKIETWSKNVGPSSLNHADTRCAVQTTIGKTITYPLPATALNPTQCAKINSAFLMTALPKSGIVRTAARHLVFSPTAVMGFGYEDIEPVQFADHIMTLLDHGNADTVTGQLTRVLAEGTMVEAGFSGDIFDMPYSKMTWMSHSWLKNTLLCFEDTNLSVKHTLPKLEAWKHNDSFIMERILRSRRFSDIQMDIINKVRMHLKVATLSDITSADGRSFRLEAINVEAFESCSSKRYRWPRTIIPSLQNKKLWNSAIRLAYATQIHNRIDPAFITATWRTTSHPFIGWWFSDLTNAVYERHINGWKKWTMKVDTRRRTRRATHRFVSSESFLPTFQPSWIPITVEYDGNEVLTTGTGLIHTATIEEEETISIWKQQGWIIRRMDLPNDDGKGFSEDIRRTEGRVVCDGSYKYGRSSSAFIPITKNTFLGTNIVPGRTEDQSAYRGELGGILGCIISTKIICKRFEVHKGKVTIGCDCESAIAACEGDRSVSCRWKCYDIVSRIKYELKDSEINFVFRHISGHQDKIKSFDELDIWEQTNVKVDKFAKEALSDYVAEGCPYIAAQISRGDKWLLTMDDVPITSDIKKTVYNSKWLQAGKEFWYRRLGIGQTYQESVDWDIVERTSAMCTRQKRIKRSKHMAHICPVGLILERRKERPTSECPRCKMVETNVHIVTCQGPDTNPKFLTSMETINEWLDHGPPQFSIAINELLRAHREQREPNWQLVSDDTIKTTMKQQWNMSKLALQWGFLHKGWVPIITEHLKGTKRSAPKWLAILSNRIWEITEDLWKHRNDVEHGNEERNKLSSDKHTILDEQIDRIYTRIPASTRLLPMTTRHFFNRPIAWRKNRKLKEKRKWIRDADVVLRGCEDIGNRSRTARNFENYFLAQTRNDNDD